MKSFPFSLNDILMLKWRIIFLLVSIALCITILITVDQIAMNANRDLNAARVNLQNAQQSVDDIEEEEATIVQYIDRYNQLSNRGAINPEDRLHLQERVAEIRAENNLFPIALGIDGQTTKRLEYPPEEQEPGNPIELQSSLVELSLPLLHENDMTRLLEQLIASPGMYQLKSCYLNKVNQNSSDYFYLGQHFTAGCEIMWYTFNLNPDNNEQP